MTIGLVGRKVGMTRIFTDEGDTLPVTVLDVSDNRITQIKSPDKDGYSAVQVTFGKRRASRVRKSLAGHLAKAGVEAGHILKEFRSKTGIDLSADPVAMQRIKDLAERTKIDLSSREEAPFNIPFITMTAQGQPLNIEMHASPSLWSIPTTVNPGTATLIGAAHRSRAPKVASIRELNHARRCGECRSRA